MATVLVISLSDLGTDPRVDRQIDFLRAEHSVVAAGFGPPAYDDVQFVELQRAPLPHFVGRARRLAALSRRLVGLHKRAYWSDPDHRHWRRVLGSVGAELVVANDTTTLPLAFSVAGTA